MAELTVQIADELYQRLLQQIRAESISLDQLVERTLTAQAAVLAVTPSAGWAELQQLAHVPNVETTAADPLTEHDLLPGMFDALTAAGAIWELDSTAVDDAIVVANRTATAHDSFAVAKDIATALQTIAQQQGVSTQTLINLWLQEKLWQLEP